MKILIIEDEKLLADSLKALLEKKGFDVECSKTWYIAVPKVLTLKPATVPVLWCKSLTSSSCFKALPYPKRVATEAA